MNFFDGVIADTESLLSSFKKNEYPISAPWADGGKNQLIFQSDTAYELDGVGFNLVTTNDLGKSSIEIIGKDLAELKGNTKFARISIVETDNVDDEQEYYDIIRKIEYAKYHYYPKGYMVRIASDTHKEAVRISKEALKDKISFVGVGSLLAKKYLENSHVKNVKIIFVTENSVDYKALEKVAHKNYDITETLNHIMNNINFDCNSCKLKPICDEVDGMKELHQKTSMM